MKTFFACIFFAALIHFGYVNSADKILDYLKNFISHDKENEYINPDLTVENIFASIQNNSLQNNSLCRTDFVENFINEDYFFEAELSGEIISGGKNIKSLEFCRDYPKIYGVFNEAAMLKKIISFCDEEKNFSIRSKKRFTCKLKTEISLENFINEISGESFFTFPENLKLINSEFILKLSEFDGEINSGSFRFFYKTETEGLYAVVVVRDDGEKITYYIAADKEKNFKIFKRGDFEKKLYENIKLRNGDVEFLLSKDNEKLSNSDIKFKECLKIFIEEEIF